MKKNNFLLLAFGCLMTSSSLFAQKFSEVEKPQASENHWSIEMLIRTKNNGGINWAAPSLRARYFFTDKWNARLQFGIGDGTGRPISEKYHYYENADGSGERGTRTLKRNSFNVQLGTEYHFLGTKKLDPYAMVGVNFGYGREMFNLDHAQPYYMPDGIVYAYSPTISQKQTSVYNVMGFDLGLGMDFYFVQNIYIGVECGLSNSYFTYKDATKYSKIDNYTPSEFEYVTPGYKTSHIGAKAEIRVGWRF